MEFTQEIDLSLRSKATLILVVSAEEERVTEDLKSLCRSTERSCIEIRTGRRKGSAQCAGTDR